MACGNVPKSMRNRVFHEDGLVCRRCGLGGWREKWRRGGYGYDTAIHGVFLSIDHIIPLSRGGTNDRENLQVLFTTCNTTKGRKLPSEMVEGKRGDDARL